MIPFGLAAWTPPIAEAATFHTALGLGLFARAGLDFRWLATDGSPAALGLLEQGEADAAFTSCLAFLQACARGAPILGVYNLFPRSCFVVFGPSDGRIARPSDLAGLRLGVRAFASSGTDWLRLLLRLEGLRGGEAETVVVGDAGVAALLGGSVDALVGSDAVLYDARRAGLRDPFVFWLHQRLPLPSDVIAVRADRVQELSPKLSAFLGAYWEGIRLAARRPSAAVAAILRVAADAPDEPRARAMLALRFMLSSPQPDHRPGWFDFVGLQRSADLLTKHGVLDGRVRVSRSFTNNLLLSDPP